MNALGTTIALFALAAASAVAAQEDAATARDPDINGRLDALEARVDEFAGKLIAKHDADGDGRVSRDETKLGEKRFHKLDANGDGAIDAAEAAAAIREKLGIVRGRIAAALERLEKHLEAGGIDKEAAREVFRARLKAMQERREKLGGELREKFRHKDKDGNGKLSREEAGLKQERFDKLDRNRDGEVGPLEARRGLRAEVVAELLRRLRERRQEAQPEGR